MSGFTVAVIHSPNTVQCSTVQYFLLVYPYNLLSLGVRPSELIIMSLVIARHVKHLIFKCNSRKCITTMRYFRINKLIKLVRFCILWGHTIHYSDSVSHLCNICFYAETAVGEDSLTATNNNRKSGFPHMTVCE